MNDSTFSSDDLVRELLAMRPQPLSARFEDRLGQRLVDAQVQPLPVAERVHSSIVAFWAMAVATAALLVIAAWFVAGQRPGVVRPAPQSQVAPIVVAGIPDSTPGFDKAPTGPMLIAYMQASRDSDAELEALLALHSRTLLPSVPDRLAAPAVRP